MTQAASEALTQELAGAKASAAEAAAAAAASTAKLEAQLAQAKEAEVIEQCWQGVAMRRHWAHAGMQPCLRCEQHSRAASMCGTRE